MSLNLLNNEKNVDNHWSKANFKKESTKVKNWLPVDDTESVTGHNVRNKNQTQPDFEASDVHNLLPR